ncbi:MAG TPA: hypothetical protein VN616_06000 [Puia sp.]|nr:hypothetical protein [Puia sp.]
MSQLPILLLLATCTAVFGQGYQKITLDDKYNNIQPEGAPKPLQYQVHAGAGLVLDCSHYDFSAIRALSKDQLPDAIHLICKSGTFDIPLNPAGETTIDASTVHPLDQGKIFHGFEKGDHVVLGLGSTSFKGGKADMLTYWVTLMDVD